MKISIDRALDLIKRGGTFRTGVDLLNKDGRLLLQGDVMVDNVNLLLSVKRLGVDEIVIDTEAEGGLWDDNGQSITPNDKEEIKKDKNKEINNKKVESLSIKTSPELDRKLSEIKELKIEAGKKYQKAKYCIIKTLKDIKETGGEFDFDLVIETIQEIFDFINDNETAFSFLTREIFSYDDYLYNHSINVFTIGTVVMKKFNENFSTAISSHLGGIEKKIKKDSASSKAFNYYMADELRDISIGFFMHDMGKVLIDPEVLNKNGPLTRKEFEVVKTHSTSKGVKVLKKNGLINPFLRNISLYHHAKLYDEEKGCYPDKDPNEIAPYVKVCKLADIYDAMTSRRSYKEALNPVTVVTDIFHKYAEKDRLLQFILHSFVKSVGIYPPGSIVMLSNCQMAYVLENQGAPHLIPITDEKGTPLEKEVDSFVLDKKTSEEKGIHIDRTRPPVAPLKAYEILPEYLKKALISKEN